MAIKPKDVKFTKAELAKINEWNTAQGALGELKTTEMSLRKTVVSFIESKIGLRKGTNNIALPADYILKIVSKISVKVDEAMVSVVQEQLREKGCTAQVFNFKPSLNKAVYDTLTPEQKDIVDEALITSPASPEVKIVEPKG